MTIRDQESKQQTVPVGEETLNWLHFATRAEGADKPWTRSYREHRPLSQRAVQAILLAREGKLDECLEQLRHYAQDLEKATGLTRSHRLVFDRWYEGALGYYYYCKGELELARRCMNAANSAVVKAISRQRFLLPLATHCHEFQLHHARIARNEKDWPRMHQAIAEAQEMTDDLRPLCVLEDGEEVYSSSLADFYHSLGALNSREEETVRDSWDVPLRRQLFHTFVRRLVTPQDLAIVYP